MKKFLVDRDAHMSGMFKLGARLGRTSKAALIAVIERNEQKRGAK
jgi:hypothetical protein